ncbi:MAG: hypothetical protein JO049_07060 [Hyphomicrobiales bacterium]|jgi:hypothetical protein|nr:hypothetical protein [Hyphomicrobiales bacterium]
MTAINPVDDVPPACEGAVGPAAQRGIDVAAQAAAEDSEAVVRITNLPRDVGWMMVSVGVLGVVLPGVPGAPFLIAGIAVLVPGGPRLLTRWATRRPKGVVHTGLKQIGRWLDDLERRYPRRPSTSS